MSPWRWHSAQAIVRCAPSSGKLDRDWSKVAGSQAVVRWQVEQLVGKPEAT